MLLEAIFKGEIYPSETVVCNSKTYNEASKSVDKATDYFHETLSEQDYERLEQMLSDIAIAQTEENCENFKNGFAMGVRLMQEIYAYPITPSLK
jgi:hypothetical protein